MVVEYRTLLSVSIVSLNVMRRMIGYGWMKITPTGYLIARAQDRASWLGQPNV
jgi:hypothetical protein